MREVEVKHITLSSSLKPCQWYLRGKQSQSPFVVDFRNLILVIMQREKCKGGLLMFLFPDLYACQ